MKQEANPPFPPKNGASMKIKYPDSNFLKCEEKQNIKTWLDAPDIEPLPAP